MPAGCFLEPTHSLRARPEAPRQNSTDAKPNAIEFSRMAEARRRKPKLNKFGFAFDLHYLCEMKTFKIVALCAAVVLAAHTQAQKTTRAEYLLRYKDIAVASMERYGIPASIKMAQGMLESDNGNSRLAIEANNHFGIKCKSDWTGEKVYHDDDAAGECFRSYLSAEESWADHSEFLDKGARYQFLFDLDPLDYKAWAQGLKDAGYATNPLYPELLIKIIEDNELYLLDQGREIPMEDIVAHDAAEQTSEAVGGAPAPGEIDVDNFEIAMYARNGYNVYGYNGVPFIVAREGDDIEGIASLFNIGERRLRRFNGMSRYGEIEAGDAVFLKKMRK
jgi:hypothetical protein